jgi:tRNA nucleotidyltransferase/poly(A) polymerase
LKTGQPLSLKKANPVITPNKHLIGVREALQRQGFDLWFVGGCVRDSIRGEEPKDIDLCTSATPEEAIQVYEKNNIRYFKTGIDHGTLTVRVNGQSYEITSLRTESNHDGRRSTVSYTRDIIEDLSRRDLTINSIAQRFDGYIIDPFGGVDDIKNHRVRMVGSASDRFKEDYLRILRFFRFHARFAGESPLDQSALEAIEETKEGLNQISGERKWQEIQKILVGPSSSATLIRMKDVGVMKSIGVKDFSVDRMKKCDEKKISRSSTVLGIISYKQIIESVMSDWRMSNSERSEARFANLYHDVTSVGKFKDLLVDGANIDWVEELLKLNDLSSLREWEVPVFPVNGLDIINKKGIKTGPAIGLILRNLRESWKKSDYKLTKKQLLNHQSMPRS